MASYVALVYDLEDPARQGCELYCIFSNFDDSHIHRSQEGESSVREVLRTDGQLHTELEGNRSMEKQLLKDLINEAYGEEIDVQFRKIRP